MTDSDQPAVPNSPDLVEMSASIVAAYVSHNAIGSDALPNLIADVHAPFSRLARPETANVPAAHLTPAVPMRKSVMPDHIVCLEDGKKFKSLKRHLRTTLTCRRNSIAKSGTYRRLSNGCPDLFRNTIPPRQDEWPRQKGLIPKTRYSPDHLTAGPQANTRISSRKLIRWIGVAASNLATPIGSWPTKLNWSQHPS